MPVVSISVPTDLLEQIDKRVQSLRVSRSQYFVHLASNDLRNPGPLTINTGPEEPAEHSQFPPAAYDFLFVALPTLANFEKRLGGREADTTLPTPSASIANSEAWRLFLADQEQILKNKWLQSELERKDIGLERAVKDWMRNHAELWR